MNVTEQQNQLCNEALRAESAGRLTEAIDLYRKAVVLDMSNPTPFLFLAHALHGHGDHERAAMVVSLATDTSPLVINAWRNEKLPDDVRQRSMLANQLLRQHFTSLHHQALIDFKEQFKPAEIARIEQAIWCQTHNRSFEYTSPRQRPHVFFVPDLAPMPIISREYMPWAQAFENACEAIREEFFEAQENQSALPYLDASVISQGEQWQDLAGKMAWASIDLYKDGVANQTLIDQCPATVKALEQTPILKVADRPREVVFSVLQENSHIPPHYGLSNTDATVHLPIITCQQSAIKVVDQVTHWQMGRVFAFDDSFEHESWNHSDQLRVNLLFEVWHPDLSEIERQAIEASFLARQKWNQQRKI